MQHLLRPPFDTISHPAVFVYPKNEKLFYPPNHDKALPVRASPLAAHGIAAAGRTFNDSGETGSYGQRSPGLDPSGENTLYSGLLGHLIQLDENASRRTNLGLINFGPIPIEVEVLFFDASGRELGRKSYALGIGKSRQINRVFRAVTNEPISGGRVEVLVSAEDGRATAWASTVDARTGDPVFQALSVEDRR